MILRLKLILTRSKNGRDFVIFDFYRLRLHPYIRIILVRKKYDFFYSFSKYRSF